MTWHDANLMNQKGKETGQYLQALTKIVEDSQDAEWIKAFRKDIINLV